jgi:hypothetical protein
VTRANVTSSERIRTSSALRRITGPLVRDVKDVTLPWHPVGYYDPAPGECIQWRGE